MIKPWKVLSSETVISDRFLTHRMDVCERADGHIIERYHAIEYPEWTIVIPLTDEGNLVLITEYRHPGGVVLTGLPGGGAEPGETDFAGVARRELVEETGYIPRDIMQIGQCYPNPATQTNQIRYFLALGCAPTGEQSLDPNEDIEVLEMPLDEYLAYESADVQHSHHAAGLYYLHRFFLKYPEFKP